MHVYAKSTFMVFNIKHKFYYRKVYSETLRCFGTIRLTYIWRYACEESSLGHIDGEVKVANHSTNEAALKENKICIN